MRLHISLLVLTCFSAPAYAQSASRLPLGEGKSDAALNELRAAPVPTQAEDLNTLQLASAQRERAASVEEKTNGLWQSWTMSICEGCGNTASYKKTVGDNLANQKSRDLSGATSPAVKQTAAVPKSAPERSGRSLYADLSPENVSQIRRMPGQ